MIVLLTYGFWPGNDYMDAYRQTHLGERVIPLTNHNQPPHQPISNGPMVGHGGWWHSATQQLMGFSRHPRTRTWWWRLCLTAWTSRVSGLAMPGSIAVGLLLVALLALVTSPKSSALVGYPGEPFECWGQRRGQTVRE